MSKIYAVYILASRKNGTLYVGVTGNLVARTWQHRQSFGDGFTSRYGVHRLVWYETHPTPADAIVREKRIKEWQRSWKVRLIEDLNPDWRDLWPDLLKN